MAETIVAVRPATQPENDSDSPGFESPRLSAQHEPVRVVRDVYEGTLHMRSLGRTYMPQWGIREDGTYTEQDKAYAERVAKAKLFNGTRKTVKGLTGMVFRKPLQVSDVPAAMQEHLENIDLAGRDVETFGRDSFDDKVQAGHGLIFVDWHDPEKARNAAGVRTAADETEARPYWVHIRKEQVKRFRTHSDRGKIVLDSFAYEESDTVADGEFGEREICRMRQYDRTQVDEDGEALPTSRVRHRSWIRNADQTGQWEPEDPGTLMGERMDEIPLEPDYANRTGYLMSAPPLLDLAVENIGHWQLRSDRDHSLHVGCVPIWVMSGVTDGEATVLKMGTSIGLSLPEGAEAGWKETAGSAYEASRNELQDIEQRMAALGLSLLVRKSRVQRTAEEDRSERNEHDSELAAFAAASGRALTGALRLHAKWMGLPSGGTITVSSDFDPHPLSAQQLAVLSELVGRVISMDTLWDMMEAGEMLPDGFDRELERQRLAEAGQDELRAALSELARMRGGQNGGPPGSGDGDGGDGGDDNSGGDDE